MTRSWIRAASVLAGLVVCSTTVATQSTGQSQKPILYVTATAHLDSQWNWTVQDTIRSFVPNTFYDNFKYFEQYPHYTFSYEGVIHYMWFKEYHPADWPTVQKYVASGRWQLAGSWIDAVDVNVPSPESLMRQALYGKEFFRQEFGKVSDDVYLPDCFGFGFALPSIAAHSGQKAFITQKLAPEWGPQIPPPFPIGRWIGPDGQSVVAQLKPGSYSTVIRSDVSVDPKWSNDPTPLGDGKEILYRLYGTGDTGGAPAAGSVEWMEKAITNPDGKVEVRNVAPDQIVHDLTPSERAALPEYSGELLMRTHGVGTYTSQAAMKKFNRQNELLADDAERAAVTATWLTGLEYPAQRLHDAWVRFLWHQFHDDVTGTSIPQAYQFSWNDELTAANQFDGVLHSSSSAVAAVLDTRAAGIPLVVYNPLSTPRRDPVDATVQFPGAPPAAITVVDAATGRDVPTQVLSRGERDARVLFLADMPSVGYKVFNVQSRRPSGATPSVLKATPTSLANARYTVTIDANGDIASIVDRDAGRELLKSPIRLEMRDDPSPTKPAWQILYDVVSAPVREYVAAPTIKVIEQGPVRAALEITRKAAGSTIVQRVSLDQGGDRVNVETSVDWRSPDTLLKASFAFAATNPKATYDLGLGTIQRGDNTPDHYEVPAQKWADLTDAGGGFGAAILNDSKYGWDKPTDNILRLTLLHTPLPRSYPYQSSNDLGHHVFTYAIAGHRGDWVAGRVPEQAAALNQPLVAFQADAHAGTLGRSVSMASLDDTTGQVVIVAMKKAEASDEIVVRLEEKYGRRAHVTLKFSGRVTAAREINAAEEPVGPAAVTNGALALDFTPYQPRTFAIRLAPASARPAASASAALALPFNLDGVSSDASRADGDFDGKGHTIAAELWPAHLDLDGVGFSLGSGTTAAKNVLVPHGETLALPAGTHDRVYVLAAAVGGDVPAVIKVGSAAYPLTVREWQGPIGQWDSRLVAPSALQEPFVPANGRNPSTNTEIRPGIVTPWDLQTFKIDPADIDKIRPSFVKRDEIAWIGTHRHAPEGNEPYVMSYVFLYGFDIPAGARTITLPNDARLRILAISVARDPAPLRLASPPYSADLHTVK